MLKFPNAPPTLLLEEPFPESTTLSKLKHRQHWRVRSLGWIALWMLNSKDSQGVQAWKSSLEEKASSVVLVPGEPLLLLFYYVLSGLQRALHLPCSGSEEEGPCASDNYSEPQRQELHLMAVERILVPVPTLHTPVQDWFCTLDPNHLGIYIHQGKAATLCPVVSAEDGEVVVRELCTYG